MLFSDDLNEDHQMFLFVSRGCGRAFDSLRGIPKLTTGIFL